MSTMYNNKRYLELNMDQEISCSVLFQKRAKTYKDALLNSPKFGRQGASEACDQRKKFFWREKSGETTNAW